jgi:uncharacterized protein (DUF1684 family)
MNTITRILVATGLIIIIIISIYSLALKAEVTDYDEKIIAHRTERDIWFSNDFNSPFQVTNTPFKRISYYEPDPKYLVHAKVIKAVTPDSVVLITNTGESQVYEIYGNALFEIANTTCLLQLLKAPESDQLFLPFMDKTSGNTTYGAGRYLDLDMPGNDSIIIDFNLAYSPYCAYTEVYSCPFPPKANVLSVAIEAGEKSYPKD